MGAFYIGCPSTPKSEGANAPSASPLFRRHCPADITGEVADPCKTRKNACPASALFQCSLIRSDAADTAAVDYKATPPPPMKKARRRRRRS